MKTFLLSLIALIVIYFILTGAETEFIESKLIISNQSYEIPDVDVKLSLNGQLVVNEEFNVGSQHNYKYFDIKLKKGENKIQLESDKGESIFRVSFETDEKRWIVVSFWHYPKDHYQPIPKHFNVEIKNTQPLFH